MEVPRIALVFGAGSSLAQAEHFRPMNRKWHPPLDYSFFETISRLKARIPAQLRAYSNDYPGPNPFAPTPGHPPLRMEEFMKDLLTTFSNRGAEAERPSPTPRWLRSTLRS